VSLLRVILSLGPWTLTNISLLMCNAWGKERVLQSVISKHCLRTKESFWHAGIRSQLHLNPVLPTHSLSHVAGSSLKHIFPFLVALGTPSCHSCLRPWDY
jgi:hypothetical protein